MVRGSCLVLFFFFQAEDGIRDGSRDWSSDVCSSDLTRSGCCASGEEAVLHSRVRRARLASQRSEERRVGEEGRSRWAPDHLKKKPKKHHIHNKTGLQAKAGAAEGKREVRT